MIKADVVLLILNCEKYREKAIRQKNTWLKTLPDTLPYFHVLGNPELQNDFEFDHENNLLYVKTKDDYISLPHKVISAYEAIYKTYDFKYILKTDDDQTLIHHEFFHTLPSFLSDRAHHYGGKLLSINSHISTYYTIHPELPKDIVMHATTYSNGRFYFLSHDAVESLLPHKTNIAKEYFEDYAIGYYLAPSYKTNALYIDSDKIFRDSSS